MTLRYRFAMLLALCFCSGLWSVVCIPLEAGAQSYSLSFSKPLYPPLTNGTPLPVRWHDTTNQYTFISLPGQSYSFFGTAFPMTQTEGIGVSTQGNLWFQHGNNTVIIDPFFTDIGYDSLSTEAGVRWQLEGGAGAHILKIEYNHVNFKGRDPNIYTSFQIWLWEQTGEIDLHFLANNIPDNSFYASLRGPYVGLFLSDTLFTDFRHIAWLTGQASSPSITTSNIVSLIGTPSNGANFELTPTSSSVEIRGGHVEGLSIYPNPARNYIEIAGDQVPIASRVISETGVVELHLARTKSIDISKLSAGCHFLDVTTEGREYLLRFVKQ